MSSYLSPILSLHSVALDPAANDQMRPANLPGEGPHLFDLNTGQGISLCDQMSLGYEFAVEALKEGIISKERPMLVIGAGVAGMMAAMTAVRQGGVPTVVVEKCRVLSVQANCPTRYVCPTQYRWPDSEWLEGRYPYDGRQMLFTWRRDYASVTARQVIREIEAFVNKNSPRIRVIAGRYVGYRILPGTRRIVPLFRMRGGRHDQLAGLPAFAVIASCAGFGVEKTEVPPFDPSPTEGKCLGLIEDEGAARGRYTGFKFWEIDRFDVREPRLGIEGPAKPNVLISGSGDGALQDFLRVVTRHASAGELYVRLRGRLPRWAARRIEEVIGPAESRFRRLRSREGRYAAGPEREMYRCWVHADVHRRHLGLVLELCRDRGAWRRIVNVLDDAVKDLRDEISVKLVYPCVHFTAYYGLNRFLALLIAAYAYYRYPDVEIFHPDTVINRVRGAEEPPGQCHLCLTAEECHGRAHDVLTVSPVSCATLSGVRTDDERGRPLGGGPFNALIVRHGIYRPRERLLNGRPVNLPPLP